MYFTNSVTRTDGITRTTVLATSRAHEVVMRNDWRLSGRRLMQKKKNQHQKHGCHNDTQINMTKRKQVNGKLWRSFSDTGFI